MQFRKYFSRVWALLFILSCLLLPNWSTDLTDVMAQGNVLPPNFDMHNIYNEQLDLPPDAQVRLSWEVDVDFADGSINAHWIVREEQKGTNNAWYLTNEYIDFIRCKANNSVQMSDQGAIFNGTKGYVICQIPSFEDAVGNLYSGTFGHGVVRCTYASMAYHSSSARRGDDRSNHLNPKPWVAASVQVDERAVWKSQFPIAYLESIGGEAEFIFQINNGRTEALIDKDYFYSSNMSDIYQLQRLWSGADLKHFIDLLDQRDTNSWTGFWSSANLNQFSSDLDESWLSIWIGDEESSQTSSPASNNYDMSSDAMTLYIGHNPEGDGTYFNGLIQNVGIDPPCTPH